MPDWLRSVVRWLIEKSLGGSIPDLAAPREQFLGAIINRLIFPKDFKQVMTGEHFQQIATACLFIAGFMWVIEFVFRGIQAVRTKEWRYHVVQWFYTGAFLCIMVPSIAGVFIGVRVFFDQLGKWLTVLLAGTNDSDVFIRQILTLSDNSFLNVLLMIVQIVIILVLWFWVVMIPFALWVSVFFLILGVSFRFVPGFGNTAFRASLNFTIFAFLGNAIVLVILAAFSGFGRLAYADDPKSLALTNTAGMLVAAFAAYKLTDLFGKQIKASIAGVVDTVGSLKGGQPDSPGPEQANREQAERRREREATDSVQASSKSMRHASDQETGAVDAGDEGTSGEDDSDPTTRAVASTPPRRRSSSTARRSQRGLTDPDGPGERGETAASDTETSTKTEEVESKTADGSRPAYADTDSSSDTATHEDRTYSENTTIVEQSHPDSTQQDRTSAEQPQQGTTVTATTEERTVNRTTEPDHNGSEPVRPATADQPQRA